MHYNCKGFAKLNLGVPWDALKILSMLDTDPLKTFTNYGSPDYM